jgi:uncharacterized linocin/CFP29 family protein
MDDLRRELAPVTDAAWKRIEDEARLTLKTHLAARKLVDFRGPLGWDYSAVNLGRVRGGRDAPAEGVEARVRQVQPLVELRVPLELERSEMDDVSRGAADPELDPLRDAAIRLALAEDRLVFYGYGDGGVRGICPASSHQPVSMVDDETQFPRAVLEAVEALREAGVAGPYAMALSAESYKRLGSTTAGGGYPVIRHVQRFIDGPIVWAPGLDGAIVLSMRGGDFELVVGRDISLGYLDHDRQIVHLYLEESLTFRVLTPKAAVSFVRA